MTFAILAILFVATFIRSAFGFGEALIAVPLLALIIPIEVAAPVAVLVSITVSVFAVAQDWRHIHFDSAGRLFVWPIPGIPGGLWLRTIASEQAEQRLLSSQPTLPPYYRPCDIRTPHTP